MERRETEVGCRLSREAKRQPHKQTVSTSTHRMAFAGLFDETSTASTPPPEKSAVSTPSPSSPGGAAQQNWSYAHLQLVRAERGSTWYLVGAVVVLSPVPFWLTFKRDVFLQSGVPMTLKKELQAVGFGVSAQRVQLALAFDARELATSSLRVLSPENHLREPFTHPSSRMTCQRSSPGNFKRATRKRPSRFRPMSRMCSARTVGG